MKKTILFLLVITILAAAATVSADAGLYPLPLFQNNQPAPQNQNNQQQPYYPPNSTIPFYPINGGDNNQPYYNYQPQPQYLPQYQQPAPQYQPNTGSYPRVSMAWNNDGSYRLTWTIKNTTNKGWSSADVDIKCVSGCELLRDQSRMRWDIPYTVERNGELTFSVNINQPYYNGYRMTFAMLNGGDWLYQFDLYI